VDRVAEPIKSAASRSRAAVDNTLEKLEKPEDAVVADPLEGWNRAVYKFNTGVDNVLLEPAANVYRFVVPKFGRERVRDFIDNLKTPVWFANDVLQGEWDRAGNSAARFGLNSTVGLLGTYDFAAKHADLPKHDEDFGQTLAVWGVGNGPYIMLPLLGPSTGRDLTGLVFDSAIDPLTWSEFEGDDTFRVTTRVVDVVDLRDRVREAVDQIESSADPYAQARAVYIQNRNRRISNGRDEYDDLPDFE
jgi:phospholipid-binding lipoprotein MlaA